MNNVCNNLNQNNQNNNNNNINHQLILSNREYFHYYDNIRYYISHKHTRTKMGDEGSCGDAKEWLIGSRCSRYC